MAMTEVRRAWVRALMPLLAVLVCLVVLYWDTASGMVAIWWRSETFTHAFLVPPMVLWLSWRRREELQRLTPRPCPWVLLPMALLAGAWFVGHLAGVNAVTQLALVALLVLSVPAVLGLQVARVLMFPLAFAFFTVPIGEFALPVLMQWTADVTVGALRLSGVPVYREGLRFVIPSGTWSVVEACSGVRYLIASLMVGSLFANLNYRSPKRQWIFVGLSILVPILANWVRAYIIVMLGHLSNNRIATGVDHLVYGWVFFGIVIMALFTIGAKWAEPEIAIAPLAGGPSEPARAMSRSWSTMPFWATAAAAVLIGAAPMGALPSLDSGAARGTELIQLSLPVEAVAGWRADTGQALNWAPDFLNPAAKAQRNYAQAGGAAVSLHVVYYRHQRSDSKLVSSTNFLLRANDYSWNMLSTADRPITAGSSAPALNARETVLIEADAPGRTARQKIHILMLYWIDGHWTSSDMGAKLMSARARLAGRGDDGAAVMLYASDLQPGGANAALQAFWRDNQALIEQRLAAARDGKP